MADERILGYLRNGLNKGHSIEALRKQLLGAGFPAHLIEEAVLAVHQKSNVSREPQKPFPNPLESKVPLATKINPLVNSHSPNVIGKSSVPLVSPTKELQTDLGRRKEEGNIQEEPTTMPEKENVEKENDSSLKEISSQNTKKEKSKDSFSNPFLSFQSSQDRFKKQGLFWKLGKTITSPKELFETTKEEGIWPALKYQFLLLLVPFISLSVAIFFFAAGISSYFGGGLFGISVGGLTGALIGIFAGILLIAYPIMNFITAGISHLFLKLYQGKGTYANTYAASIYSSTPLMLLLAIAPIAPLASIWTFVLLIKGTSSYHSISKWRSFLALFTPLIILGIIWLVSLFLFPGAELVGR